MNLQVGTWDVHVFVAMMTVAMQCHEGRVQGGSSLWGFALLRAEVTAISKDICSHHIQKKNTTWKLTSQHHKRTVSHRKRMRRTKQTLLSSYFPSCCNWWCFCLERSSKSPNCGTRGQPIFPVFGRGVRLMTRSKGRVGVESGPHANPVCFCCKIIPVQLIW